MSERITLPFLDGCGPEPGRSVWFKEKLRKPVLRIEHTAEGHSHPNDWQKILYDDGTCEERHHENHSWCLSYMALERVGSLRDYAEKQINENGWRIAVGKFRKEPRVYGRQMVAS